MSDRRDTTNRTRDHTKATPHVVWTGQRGAHNLDDAATELADVIEWAADTIRERWKLAILWLLAPGPLRYNDLHRRLPGITPKMLADQLTDLARDCLVVRNEHVGGAKHVEYSLTPLGEALRPVTDAFEVWARQYAHAEQERSATPQRAGDSAKGRR